MKLYHELAEWWPILSAPEDYKEEANLFMDIIDRHKNNIRTGLELGSGGGNNALYFKERYEMTLTDLSGDMIAVSQKLNPECAHHLGDMREVQLEMKFDLVFIHDAISYMTTENDLEKVFQVAHNHLKEDGLLFIAPDSFQETFDPYTSKGGHDAGDRSLRYLEWCHDQNPDDNLVEVDYVYLLHENGETKVEHDQAIYGLFKKDTWKNLLTDSGFEVTFEDIPHSELEPGSYVGIVCKKRD